MGIDIAKKAKRTARRKNKEMHRQHALTSNVRIDNDTADQTTQGDSMWHFGCSISEQVQGAFDDVSVPFAHYNGRCPRRQQTRVPKEDQFYKPGRSPRKRVRKASNKPQVVKVQTFRECNEHLRALADMKGKVIYMT